MSSDAPEFEIDGVDSVTPVVYGTHNVVLRSNRTTEAASLAALDPEAYQAIASVEDADFSSASAEESLGLIAAQPDAVNMSP